MRRNAWWRGDDRLRPEGGERFVSGDAVDLEGGTGGQKDLDLPTTDPGPKNDLGRVVVVAIKNLGSLFDQIHKP